MDEIKNKIKAYLLDEFLPGEDPENLTDSTPLVTGGILDSLATLKVVAFLEEAFHVSIEAHEADTGNLNTITDMANLVNSKIEKG